MNRETLQLEYEVDYRQFRKIWFDYFKKGLPNLLALWGTGILGCLLAFYFFDQSAIFGLITIFFVTIPLLALIINYQTYMKAARQNFSSLSDEERIVHLTFQTGTDGFDSRNGKNFSHVAWESIKEVREFDDCFVFNRAGHGFYIPKSAFRDDSEIGFLRFLVSVNVNKNVKLLD